MARIEAIPVAAVLATPDVRDPFLDTLVADPDDHLATAAIQAVGATKLADAAANVAANGNL